MNELRRIEPLQAQVNDYIIRFWEGNPGKPEKIISLFAQGISLFGKQYALGYTDHFGKGTSTYSFSASEADDGTPYRGDISAGF
jgi:hypothetical protein